MLFDQVLDEADRLLNEEFEKSLDEILSVIPRDRKTYLFSATMTKKVLVYMYAQFCLFWSKSLHKLKLEAYHAFSKISGLTLFLDFFFNLWYAK